MARTKKEFSKEAMYKKIMPSMLRGNEESNEESNENNSANSISSADNISTVKEVNSVNFINTIDNINIEDLADESIGLFETTNIINEEKELFSSSNTKIYNTYDDKTTVNLVELLVRDKLDSVLEKFKCCKCQSCKNDIVVIALNNLPVHYFSGNKKEIEEALREFKISNKIDIITEIIKAIILVRKKEKH